MGLHFASALARLERSLSIDIVAPCDDETALFEDASRRNPERTETDETAATGSGAPWAALARVMRKTELHNCLMGIGRKMVGGFG